MKSKSDAKEDKNEFNHVNEFGESSEDTSGFFESSSTLNNETSYKCSTTSEHSDGRLRSRKMQQQVSENFFSSFFISKKPQSIFFLKVENVFEFD